MGGGSSMQYMTPDEIVSYLKHSDNPAILVEGSDDMGIFNLVEAKVPGRVRVLPCGGRKALFRVYERRDEFRGLPVAFLADSDMFYFTGIPDEYADIVFTTGYSIENDVIADSNILALYGPDILDLYEAIKCELARWWAFEVSEYLANRCTCFDVKIQSMLLNIQDSPTLRFGAFCTGGRVFVEPPSDFVEEILSDFELSMRGHQLCDVHRILSSLASGGGIRIKSESLTRFLAVCAPSPHFLRLMSEVSMRLGKAA